MLRYVRCFILLCSECRCVPTGSHTLNFGIKLSLVSFFEPQYSVHRNVRGPQKPSGKAPGRRHTAFFSGSLEDLRGIIWHDWRKFWYSIYCTLVTINFLPEIPTLSPHFRPGHVLPPSHTVAFSHSGPLSGPSENRSRCRHRMPPTIKVSTVTVFKCTRSERWKTCRLKHSEPLVFVYEVRTGIRWPSTLNLLRIATCHGQRPFCVGCPPMILRKDHTPVWFARPQSSLRGDLASPALLSSPSLPFPLLQTPLSSSPSTSAEDTEWK